MANKVKYNLKNVHYAIQTITSTGAYSYGTPVAIPGAVNLSLSPRGDSYVFYADGIEYYKNNTNDGYEGDLEIAMIPDSFRTSVLGEELDSAQNLVEKAGKETVYFALGFQVDGDESDSMFWYYNMTAERPNQDAATKEESIEVKTDTLSISCSPRTDDCVRIRSTEATATSVKQAWFTAVVNPVTTG